jgi:hypothetical protein
MRTVRIGIKFDMKIFIKKLEQYFKKITILATINTVSLSLTLSKNGRFIF